MNHLSEDEASNPFPGLRPFSTDEEDRFFGRERQVDAMVDKLEATHFLAVVGTSGSGKSSLVNCGLRPALLRGLMAGAGSSWCVAQFRPGTNPIGAMAKALAEEGALFRDLAIEGLTLPQLVDVNLRMSKLGLIDIVQQAALEDGVNLLLVVDQFEELFRYGQLAAAGSDSGQRNDSTAFVNLLLEVAERAPERIFVVLTMRSDFLGDCTKFSGLVEAINAGQYLVPRLTRDERRAAIEGPIQVAGAEISPVLLTQLVNDVGDDPDQLSILQHALNRTWSDWRKQGGHGPLELTHYTAIGTMSDALNQHANEAFGELNERQQHICAKMFKALTDKATDPRGVRRPTRLSTLCVLTDATAAELTSVIDVFRMRSRSFLMPPISESLQPERVIDISHESLMRVWKLLEHWANEEAESERIYHRLADTAADYAVKKASLYRDPELQVALAWRERERPNETWAERYHPGFARAMEFLEKSRVTYDAELEEAKRRGERDLETARKKARSSRMVAASMGMLALVTCAVGVFAWRSWVVAERLKWEALDAKRSTEISLRQAELTRARWLTDEIGQDSEDKSRNILLALESLPDLRSSDPNIVRRPLVFEMQRQLFDAIKETREFAVLSGHTERVNSVAVTADGSRVVTGSDDGSVRLWEIGTGKELRKLVDGGATVLAVAVTPDGQRIVAGSGDHIARVWSVEPPKKQFDLPAGEGRVMAVAITPDAKRVVTGAEDGSVRVWDIETGKLLLELKGHDGAVLGVAVTPDGENFVTASADKTVRIWDAKTGQVLRKLEGHTRQVTGVVVTLDGSQIITWSRDRTIRAWDTKTGEEGKPIISGKQQMPFGVAMVPDSHRLVAALDETVRVYEAGTNTEIEIPDLQLKGHEGDVLALAVTLDGKRVITGSADRTVRVWGFSNSNSLPDKLDTASARQTLVDLGKRVVPRCLTIAQRQKLVLGPKPPDWCIDLEKYPYNTKAWKNWRAGKEAVDRDVALAYADFADKALKGVGDLDVALEAANLSVQFDRSLIWTRVNLAHAHMIVGETDLARTEYLEHCRDKLELGMSWKEAVLMDFGDMRANGRDFPLMKDIERAFNSEVCVTKADKS